ncbi:hypothetical protein MACJ_003526 [Theileria orientalis]|uniref:Uncharacterized protein n=1 Tax=Theileria orientalis TaxID=68886 RepID=A0A976SKQ2_THEOR|nr:hypothetical protein MACJ_003526 [Theileria orientalis]
MAIDAHLFVECPTYYLEDDKLSNFCYVVKHLLACTASEKSIYRESSKGNLKNLKNKSNKHLNQRIIWKSMEHTNKALDIPKFANYVELSLNSGDINVIKSVKQMVIKLPNALSELKLKESIKETKNKKLIREFIKKEYPPNLQ